MTHLWSPSLQCLPLHLSLPRFLAVPPSAGTRKFTASNHLLHGRSFSVEVSLQVAKRPQQNLVTLLLSHLSIARYLHDSSIASTDIQSSFDELKSAANAEQREKKRRMKFDPELLYDSAQWIDDIHFTAPSLVWDFKTMNNWGFYCNTSLGKGRWYYCWVIRGEGESPSSEFLFLFTLFVSAQVPSSERGIRLR